MAVSRGLERRSSADFAAVSAPLVFLARAVAAGDPALLAALHVGPPLVPAAGRHPGGELL
ncbi:hypothetical protein AB0C81_14225 [Streptomyces roseoverticillatus]|uniref:hypothetical protein n=1 Tax=Streptomyces roseoverticillatus TaxID=66429 RepID=UPI0033D56F02